MKKERDSNVIFRAIINKMLECCNLTIDDVIGEKGKIDGVEWFRYYTMTQKQHDDWKEWTMNYLKSTYIHKSRREKEFAMLDLMWGLRIKD